ncbi:hypothetical protein B0I31_1339 [Saccharothrix carnea]|uniref:Uncharacterized protein n=1 Tax=Saccharothrix carnea TaxID=1280637 RepID=A0A2P8H9V2_SACCR|nr:hypothetical protein [Saccharothrix carnea]PSL43002.1 hypothetical protein B0I31_1339 [Saccharothrix carnea]
MDGADPRVAQLCLRLADDTGPLAKPGPLRDLAVQAAQAIRTGADTADDDLDRLDDMLLREGYAAGLGASRSSRLPGLGGGHPLLEVLTCPADRCDRVEPPTGAPPMCAVLRRPLRRLSL